MSTRSLPPKTLIANRFEIEATAGSGGMGVVYKARDRRGGGLVALKLIEADEASNHDKERFDREARTLAELSHPGIVAYVDHGALPDGEPYLAMEWLEGEDLGRRLARGPLNPLEAVTLAQKAAEALDLAHRRGVVHRDLKPSNLFLPKGKIDGVKLLDFGVARRAHGTARLTRTGALLGTPGYMAPEQARGERAIGPEADIFSLGCVLFECLTGRPPFAGAHMAAVLAKILFDEPPDVLSLCPSAPPAFADLVARMLRKDAAERPQGAGAVLSEIARMIAEPGFGEEVRASWMPVLPSSLAGAEKRMLSVIIASEPEGQRDPSLAQTDPDHEALRARRESVRRALEQLGARAEWMGDGSLVATLVTADTATDQVLRTARCALAAKERWPAARAVMATVWGVVSDREALSKAIDLAATLAADTGGGAQGEGAATESDAAYVWLDELSARLLHGRYEILDVQGRRALRCDAISLDTSRLLLGKATPCVGRKQELTQLEVALRSCVEEPAARAVLVTAAPGVGKSRLRHELLRVLDKFGRRVEVLIGYGDPMTSGSPYALIRQALRRYWGIQAREPLASQLAKLRERVSEVAEPARAPRIIEFLGELCGVASDGEVSPQLRAARGDPKAMADQIASAFVDWLRAQCRVSPSLLVLEDLHWGDAPTIHLLDIALRELSNEPLMVFALARPEIDDVFPRVWSERRVQSIRMKGLSRKASEQLIREVVGDELDAKTVARIIEQAQGNALFLEELLRAAAEGKGEAAPDTVLAILKTRISRLDPEARRVLRGASIFGQTFWVGGVLSLYGPSGLAEEVEGWLSELVTAEILERRSESRFHGETELAFRHALMREAAYDLLTEEDRGRGHHLAAAFLERVGEGDPSVLAEHFRLGGDLERAAVYYLAAAQQSYDRNALDATLASAGLGIQCGARGEQRGALRQLQAAVHYWREQYEPLLEHGAEALELTQPGETHWYRALMHLFVAATVTGQREMLGRWLALFDATEPERDARSEFIQAAAWVTNLMCFMGMRGPATALLERMGRVCADLLKEEDVIVTAFYSVAEGSLCGFIVSEPWRRVVAHRRAQRCFEEIGNRSHKALNSSYLYAAVGDLGSRREALAGLREAYNLAKAVDEPLPLSVAMFHLARLLTGESDPALAGEGVALANELIKMGNPFHCGIAHRAIAEAALRAGDVERAEAEARASEEAMRPFPNYWSEAVATRARATLAEGRADEARQITDNALAELGRAGLECDGILALRLINAEACDAAGEPESARAALREAVRCLEARAAGIPEPEARERYLTRVAENARVVELARDWLGTQVI